MRKVVLEPEHWEQQYRDGLVVWDTGRSSSELTKVVAELQLAPCRTLELGCGTGSNAVWLARQGFAVTALDLSAEAIRRARRRARAAGVRVAFRVADLRDKRSCRPGEERSFAFFLDAGCYHAVRQGDRAGYFAALDRLLAPGARGLVLAGNADEPEDRLGPPVLTEAELRAEWGGAYEVERLRPFRWDARPGGWRYLGWSCLVRRR